MHGDGAGTDLNVNMIIYRSSIGTNGSNYNTEKREKAKVIVRLNRVYVVFNQHKERERKRQLIELAEPCKLWALII